MAPLTLPSRSTPSSQPRLLKLEPLTPSSFSPFGTAIDPPFPSTLLTPPTSAAQIPGPLHPSHQPRAILANQSSALKTSPISQFMNNYQLSSNPDTVTPLMSLFSCFPRNLSSIGITTSSSEDLAFNVEILERHPFTTQTFSPLGLSASESSTVFLVIVAPSLPGSITATLDDYTSKIIVQPPDLTKIRAFLARGDQAVTYAPGTWHAPMVVVGHRRVDFLVSQFANGVGEDDCQEVLLGGNKKGVDLSGLNLGRGCKSKL